MIWTSDLKTVCRVLQQVQPMVLWELAVCVVLVLYRTAVAGNHHSNRILLLFYCGRSGACRGGGGCYCGPRPQPLLLGGGGGLQVRAHAGDLW